MIAPIASVTMAPGPVFDTEQRTADSVARPTELSYNLGAQWCERILLQRPIRGMGKARIEAVSK